MLVGGGVPTMNLRIDYLKPAVKQTGFDLLTVAEQPKAGSIDDRIRVEIRNSKFIIADLTNSNNEA